MFALRLYAPVFPPEIKAAPERFYIGPIPLAVEWLAQAECSRPKLPPELAAAPKPSRQPPAMKGSAIFNGVLHPIIPNSLAGILWYQRESNTGTGYDHREIFPLFITGLREKWNQPSLPLYFCQLTNNNAKRSAPGESAWAETRESQTVALKLPDTAQTVLIDLGESGDLHSRDKLTAKEHYGTGAGRY